MLNGLDFFDALAPGHTQRRADAAPHEARPHHDGPRFADVLLSAYQPEAEQPAIPSVAVANSGAGLSFLPMTEAALGEATISGNMSDLGRIASDTALPAHVTLPEGPSPAGQRVSEAAPDTAILKPASSEAADGAAAAPAPELAVAAPASHASPALAVKDERIAAPAPAEVQTGETIAAPAPIKLIAGSPAAIEDGTTPRSEPEGDLQPTSADGEPAIASMKGKPSEETIKVSAQETSVTDAEKANEQAINAAAFAAPAPAASPDNRAARNNAPQDQTAIDAARADSPAKAPAPGGGQPSAAAPDGQTTTETVNAASIIKPPHGSAAQAEISETASTPDSAPQADIAEFAGTDEAIDISAPQPASATAPVTGIAGLDNAQAALFDGSLQTSTSQGQAGTVIAAAAPVAGGPQPAATQPMMQPQAAVALVATPSEVVDIVSTRLAGDDRPDRITVQLDPPELGRVSIEFKFDAQGLQQVAVRGETAEAVRQLRLLHFDLVQSLEQQGLNARDMTFSQGFAERGFAQGGNAPSPMLDAGMDAEFVQAAPPAPALIQANRLPVTHGGSGLNIKL